MTEFSTLRPEQLITPEGFDCDCGKKHSVGIKYLDIAPGAINNTVKMLKAVGCAHPMVVCGPNGYRVAGMKVEQLLRDEDIPFSTLVIPSEDGRNIAPAEFGVGSIVLHFDKNCDGILAVGSGVINDLCKCAAVMARLPVMIIGTAPSMDGYASNGAAMEVNNIKLSLTMKYPEGIICDSEIMAQAPMRLIWAGLGDMLAKYTALCEWHIAHVVRGEPYCPEIVKLVRASLKKVREGAAGVKERNVQSIQSIAEGLVLSGIAMTFAGISRPASGLEHYFSHCWEMMALARGKEYDLHGIQVGVGTLMTLRIFRHLTTLRPDMAHAEAAADAFDEKAWADNIRRVFGGTAEGIIAMENKARKNERTGRLARAKSIIDNWDEVCNIINTELPAYEDIYALMEGVGMPLTSQSIGYSVEDTVDAFVCSRDVREKYLLSSMIWDVGLLDECAQWLRGQIE